MLSAPPLYESVPTLNPGRDFRVEQMKYRHVFRAAKTFVDASIDDPFVRYIRNGKRPSRAYKAVQRMMLTALIGLSIRSKLVLTVRAGRANIIATPPEATSGPKDPCARLAERLLTFLMRGFQKILGSDVLEQKRRKEFNDKMAFAVAQLFGDNVSRMWYVNNLATDPSYQRRGYGGALVDAINSLAEMTAQTVWVQSSNIANTGFYEQHGFVIVGEVVLGDKDPEWHDTPVVIRIMIRVPESDKA